VKRNEDNQDYALKKVKIQSLTDREKENALNEVRILASIRNPFVAAYKEAFFDEPSSSLW
jgi:NIMA (never in mitosis gene a)-related kinase 1/4/5